MSTTQVFIRYFSPCGDPIKDLYVSVQGYIDTHQDSYQWDQDTDLYEFIDGRFILL